MSENQFRNVYGTIRTLKTCRGFSKVPRLKLVDESTNVRHH